MSVCTTHVENAKDEAANPEFRPLPAALRLPELLAPAGDWECAQAAVENGADAIYFGLERFNARMRAQNFTVADLPKLMEFLHRRGVKGYVTFNTLVFANELADAENYLRAMIAAGVDAAIVQDVGICRLIRRISPDFPIHASTQMTVTSAAGVEFARNLGCNMVVLARECSIKEIETIQSAQTPSGSGRPVSDSKSADITAGFKLDTSNLKLPLEVFVHGALCVAYSGQCLTSEALGGRSANRGECAQACRMPYELISDGRLVPLGDKRYLLSPQDLAGLEVLPDLIRAGLASLKIEGRLKSPEYVANITRVYRKALDDLRFTIYDLRADGNSPAASERSTARKSFLSPQDRYEIEMAFSRGLYTGWLRGINNQALAHARFGKKRGVFLGEVDRILGWKIEVKLQAPLKRGDGVVFDAGHPDQQEEGGRIYSVEQHGSKTLIGFGRGDLDFNRISTGNKIWKTSDPELDRRLRKTFTSSLPCLTRPLDFEVHGGAGKAMTIVVRDEMGRSEQAVSAMPLLMAENRPLTTDRLREQLGRLGGTPFHLGGLKNLLEGEVLLPLRELNRLRRDLVDRLERARGERKSWSFRSGDSGLGLHGIRPSPDNLEPASQDPKPHPDPKLTVLVRSLSQLNAALSSAAQVLYCDFENPKRYQEAVSLVRSASLPPDSRRPEIWVAPPRITKMGEEWILKLVRSCNADGYLVRNYDQLEYFADSRRIGDFSFNIANPLSADYFMNHFGLERVTASYDLNFTQLEALLKSAPPDWFEITIHQHVPMFHMEHCVFCAFLSSGTDYTNCGRPCDQHEVKLRDRVGAEHPLKADLGCRNTVFSARAQTGAEYVTRMLALGVRNFRIEFVNETPEQVAQVLSEYGRLFRGETTGLQLWRALKLLNQLGVTRGQMEKAE